MAMYIYMQTTKNPLSYMVFYKVLTTTLDLRTPVSIVRVT